MPRSYVLVLHSRIDPADQDFACRAERRLPPQLRERAGWYRRPEDRCRFVVGRLLLGVALRDHQPPGAPNLHHGFRADRNGRLALPHGPDFNLAHSGAVVVCAVAPGCRVGVDVEPVRPLDLHPFATCFAPAEWRLIQSAASPEEAFFQGWTAKESVLKGDGRGLKVPLSEVRFTGMKASLDGTCWFLHPLTVGPGYAAHVAVDRGGTEVIARELPAESLLFP
jgi:4'-phosphopantetheinyl transferase